MRADVGVAVAAAAAIAIAVLRLRRELRECQEALAAESKRRDELAMDLMCTRNKFMHTAESVERGQTFTPRPSDVFVVTYPKCGTTWVTQIVHALRTRCSMDYGEITEVVPWDILAHDCGQDLDADHVASPRVWKSHEPWEVVAKGGRYIYVARDPLDAFVSFHKFLPAYCDLRPGDISQQAFADAIFAGVSQAGGIWNHFLGFWEQRRNPDVLWVFFEDLVSDLRGSVERIARWLGFPHDEALLDEVCRVASFDFMASKDQAHHFDDRYVRRKILPKMGMDPETPVRTSKVRAGGGKVGTRSTIPPAVRERLAAKWASILVGPTGCADYEALRAQLGLRRPQM